MISYLRNSGYGAKIILLSGYKEFEYAKRAIDYDVFSYIVKPVNEVELIKVLHVCLWSSTRNVEVVSDCKCTSFFSCYLR